MPFEALWEELREQCLDIDPDTVLTTPNSDRPFDFTSIDRDRIEITYVESGAERTLWRDQFEVLCNRIDTDSSGLSYSDLPSGVEPYVAVLSLSPQYVADDDRNVIRPADGDKVEQSPFLVPEWTGRTQPERIHDDALLLVDLLERLTVDDLASLPGGSLVDLYVLLSDVQRGSDRFRRTVSETLLDYIGPDAHLHGQFGTVHRTVRERRRLKDDDAVLAAIDEEGIPREWVMGVDPSKLDVVLAVTDLEEAAVYDTDEQVYVQKTAVDEEEKQSRLQGLSNRLAEVEEEAADDLQEEIEALEDRLDELLAAG